MVTTARAKPRAYLFIEEWMRELGLNDESVAAKLKTSRVTVWRWRNEQHRLNPQKIADLAWAMGREPVDLWHPPSRPSVDAILSKASPEVAAKAAEIVTVLVRSTT